MVGVCFIPPPLNMCVDQSGLEKRVQSNDREINFLPEKSAEVWRTTERSSGGMELTVALVY